MLLEPAASHKWTAHLLHVSTVAAVMSILRTTLALAHHLSVATTARFKMTTVRRIRVCMAVHAQTPHLDTIVAALLAQRGTTAKSTLMNA